MTLVRVPIHLHETGSVNLRLNPSLQRSSGLVRRKILFHQTHQLLERDIPDRANHHPVREIITFHKIQHHTPGNPFHGSLVTQNIPSDRVTGINQLLEIVENQLSRVILVRVYLIQYHVFLLLYLLLREHRMKHDVGKQFQRTLVILCHKRGIHARVLLRGVSIQLTPNIFQTTQYMIGFTFLRTFKNHVFYKMSHSQFILPFIPAPHVYNQPAISGFIRNIVMD